MHQFVSIKTTRNDLGDKNTHLYISVAESLVLNAERSEEGGIRAKTLAILCDVCPYLAASVRAKAASVSRLPALVINLTLTHHQDDLVI